MFALMNVGFSLSQYAKHLAPPVFTVLKNQLHNHTRGIGGQVLKRRCCVLLCCLVVMQYHVASGLWETTGFLKYTRYPRSGWPLPPTPSFPMLVQEFEPRSPESSMLSTTPHWLSLLIANCLQIAHTKCLLGQQRLPLLLLPLMGCVQSRREAVQEELELEQVTDYNARMP